MNLDKRIKSKLDILSCFDIEKAKEFVGQKGYFANDLYCFSVVETCYYDTLTEVFDGDSPFKDDDGCYWNLFIPERVLKPKPKEKKYRPFKNTKEFFLMRNFKVGDLIHIRTKANNQEYQLLITGCTDNKLMLGSFYSRSFNELLQDFELWNCDYNKFIPFGVEE